MTDISDQIEFDFGIFHPLDHSLLSVVECNHWYGGTWRHLELEWELRKGQELRSWFWRNLNCRRDRHHFQPFWHHAPQRPTPRNDGWWPEPTGYMCVHCEKTRKLET